jgi:hypothetical protein
VSFYRARKASLSQKVAFKAFCTYGPERYLVSRVFALMAKSSDR